MSDDIDRDAIEVLGINPKIWKEYRKMTKPTYTQDDLPGMLKAEAEARESDISQETKEDFNNRLSMRWIKYNQLAKNADEQLKLFRQYRIIAQMHRGRER